MGKDLCSCYMFLSWSA